MAAQHYCVLLASDYETQEEFAILVSALVYCKRTWNYPVRCSLAKSAIEIVLSANQVEKLDCTLDINCDPLMDNDSIYQNMIISADEVETVSEEAKFQPPRFDLANYQTEETEESFKDRLVRLLVGEITGGAVILTPSKCVKTCFEVLGQNPENVSVYSVWVLDTESQTATIQWQQETKDELKAALLQIQCFFEAPPEPLLPTRKPPEEGEPPAVHPPQNEAINRISTQLLGEIGPIEGEIPPSDDPTQQLLLAVTYALKASREEINQLKFQLEREREAALQASEDEVRRFHTLQRELEELREISPILHFVMQQADEHQEEMKAPDRDLLNPKKQDGGRELLKKKQLEQNFSCSKCGQLAAFFCLCVSEKVYLCNQCLSSHMSKEDAHVIAPVAANYYVKQPSDLVIYNKRLEITMNAQKAMDSILAAVGEEEKSLAQSIAEEKQKVIDSVNQAFDTLQRKVAAECQAVREVVEQGRLQLSQFEKDIPGSEGKALDRWTSLSVHFPELRPLLLEVSDFCRESVSIRIEEIQREVHHPIHVVLKKWEASACSCGQCASARYILRMVSTGLYQALEGEYDSCFFRQNQTNIAEIETYVVEQQGEGALQAFRELAAKWQNPSMSKLFSFTQALVSADLRDERTARTVLESRGFQFK